MKTPVIIKTVRLPSSQLEMFKYQLRQRAFELVHGFAVVLMIILVVIS